MGGQSSVETTPFFTKYVPFRKGHISAPVVGKFDSVDFTRKKEM